MKTNRPTTHRPHRKRRAADEAIAPIVERAEAPAQALATLRSPQLSAEARGRAALGLQRAVGNAQIERQLARRETESTTIQRFGAEAATWIAIGSLGWGITQGTLANAGDLAYSFDELVGTKFPNDDKEKFQTLHKYPRTTGRQEIDVWFGFRSLKKLGIKFAVDYEYDGYSISSISMGLLDTYDWPLWSGNVQVNLTPLERLVDGSSAVRITINLQADRTVAPSKAGNVVLQLTGAGSCTQINKTSSVFAEIS